jgi:hypothetical protein
MNSLISETYVNRSLGFPKTFNMSLEISFHQVLSRLVFQGILISSG